MKSEKPAAVPVSEKPSPASKEDAEGTVKAPSASLLLHETGIDGSFFSTLTKIASESWSVFRNNCALPTSAIEEIVTVRLYCDTLNHYLYYLVLAAPAVRIYVSLSSFSGANLMREHI